MKFNTFLQGRSSARWRTTKPSTLRRHVYGKQQGINEEIHRELSDICSDLRSETQDIRTEIRSTRNTLLMVNLLLWVATIGTMVGFFVTQ
jgi:predicted O-linked N-acetylglucosamine transferase (SPINDLY family)